VTADRRLLVPFLAAAIALAIVLDLHRPVEAGIDFHTYEAAGLVGVQQGWTDLYDQGLVKLAQQHLVPGQRTQPFLSPPPVAWITAPLGALPYQLAFDVWSLLTLGALVLALAVSTSYRGWRRVVAVAAALVPWWVLYAVSLGQVVPLVAAGILVAWRLLRDKQDLAAGFALSLILLKPNTAILVPFVLVASGRIRIFTAWLAVSVVVVGVSVATIGPEGVSAYVGGLSHLPGGANQLTLYGTYGLTGVAATVVRLFIVAAALATAYKLRSTPGLAVAVGALASLIVAPYIHGSDLIVFVAAGWITWHELPSRAWRVALAAIWVVATPFVFDVGAGALLSRWALAELALFIGIVVWAWAGDRLTAFGGGALTGTGDVSKHAPA
jgi:alpha-1,2-mannosyltransferase